MSRPLDRALGNRAAPADTSFSTRPFGVSKAEAAKIAAAAEAAKSAKLTVAGDPNPSLQAAGRASGASGGAGAGTNLTTSTYASTTSRGTSLP